MGLIIAAAALVALVFLIGYRFRWLFALGLIVLLVQNVYYNVKLTGMGFVNAATASKVYQLPKVRDQLDAELSSNKFTFDIAGIKHARTGKVFEWEVSPTVVIHNTTDRRIIAAVANCTYQVIDNDQFTKIETDVKGLVLDIPPGESKSFTYAFKNRIRDETGGGLRAIRCFTHGFKEFDQWQKPN